MPELGASASPQGWKEVDRALPGRVFRRGGPGWDDARRSFNGVIDRHPAAIVSCARTADVVVAVRHARSAGLPIAVRGGGHSVAGHSVPDGALVISLDRMRDVDVDPVTRLARVGGGALWEDVDPAAQARGLAVPGGTFADTGVGGLTLGGGIGWLLGIAGLTCDNLVAAEVVTADGAVVAAGPDGDPELLWALRGGGGNFGVVTRFDFRLTPVGEMYGGTIRYPAEAASAVYRRVLDVMAAAPPELLPMFGLHRDPESSQTIIGVLIAYAGPSEEAETVISPLRRDLPIVADELAPRTYLEIQALAGELPFGLRHYWKSHFLRELDLRLFEELVGAAAGAPGAGFILIEPIIGLARREPEGGAAFGQRGARWNVSALGIWESPDDDEVSIAWARQTASLAERASFSGGGYANYASMDESDDRVRAAFGAERLERLAAVKRRYDPDNVFRFNLNIPPAPVAKGG